MSPPRVSVVIPSYNYGAFVAETVESALAQTVRPHEVIVVDDGSTDDTRARLAPYADRVRYVHQANRGLSAARNHGIAEATGDWIALLDADDLWHPEKTALQLRALERYPEARLIGAAAGPRDLPERLPAESAIRPLDVLAFLLRAPFAPSSALIRRDCFDVVGGFDEQLRAVEDRDMWLRIAVDHPAILVETPCWWYRLHPGQMSKRTRAMHENYELVLAKFFRENPRYGILRPQAEGFLNLDTALAFLAEQDRKAAARYALRSLRCWPRGFGGETSEHGRFLRLRIIGRHLKDFLVRPPLASTPARSA